MVDFERLARPGVRELRAYDPGHDLVALRRRTSRNSPRPPSAACAPTTRGMTWSPCDVASGRG